MGLGSFFKNLGSNIVSGAKKTRNFLNTAKSGITDAISSGSKKAWSAVKEYGPELAGMTLKGVEQVAPHFGPVGELVHKASKAISPHISKALGEKFDKVIIGPRIKSNLYILRGIKTNRMEYLIS
jgi:hypothetical protein